MLSYPKTDSLSIMDGNTVIEPRLIDKQLHRILSSTAFKATPRQKKFLQFVVEKFLQGRTHEIKGYVIATSVFARKKDFDQATDPIVSIEARQLRRALEYYYLVGGIKDQVRIDMPSGGYVPTFRFQTENQPADSSPAIKLDNRGIVDHWPSILIRPFKYLTKDKNPNFLVEGLSSELAIELNRYKDIQVLLKLPDNGGQPIKEPYARFQINGSVFQELHWLKVAVQLIDQKTSKQLWGEVYKYDFEATNQIDSQEELAQIIAANIAQEQGLITNALTIELRNKLSSEMGAYEAILKYYKHDKTFTPETFRDALDALEQVVITAPECYQVWIFLSRLYLENYGLEVIERETPIEKAIDYAKKGIQLEPTSQRARTWLAFAYLLNDQLLEGRVEANNALVLNPRSLMCLDVIGSILALLGDWDQGTALIRKAIKLNPHYRSYVRHIFFLNWLRQKDYDKAYMETLNFRLPALFWEPMYQAVILGHLGRIKEANHKVEELIKLKPNFPERSRSLIKRFIKSDELVESMIEGLKKAGLDLEK